MKTIRLFAGLVALAGVAAWMPAANAQTANVVQDSFTGASANLKWSAFNGACLTAGNGTGSIPACKGLAYYGTQVQAGLTSNADTVGNGALRLTNGCSYDSSNNATCNYSQNGAIISQTTFPSNEGIQVTFTTYAYSGNSGGGAQDGADGIGFYLLDADQVPHTTSSGTTTYQSAIGSWGGSLGYSCSNVNPNYDGMLHGYIGLGMDEYGNFLNGAGLDGIVGDNTASGQPATNSNGGDGRQYQPQRIGLRGYGNVNLATLRQFNASATQSDVQNACINGGVYSYSTYTFTYTYPPNGNYTTLTTTKTKLSVPAGSSGKNYSKACRGTTTTTKGGAGSTTGTPVSYGNTGPETLYQQISTTTAPSTQTSLAPYSYGPQTYSCEQTTTTTTTTYNYTAAGTTVAPGVAAGGMGFTGSGTPFGFNSKTNSYYPISWVATPTGGTQKQKFPDYKAIANAYVNLPTSTPIANESATTRSTATPIAYKLQITQDGLLSLWYAYNGGTYTPVLTNQSISATNGTMPTNFLFGFGGSTGGSDNVHEITCFQATPANLSASSAGINVQQTGEIQTGTQVYLAYYHPNNWWGELDSQNLVYNPTTGTVSIQAKSNWDASCVLTGGNCPATGATGTTAQYSTTGGRTLLTWTGGPNDSATTAGGIPFAWASLSATEQAWLQGTDTTQVAEDRVNYLSGDRTNEVTSSGTGEFRNRSSVLGDIINSSPTWLGPPASPYPDTWRDLLYPSATVLENGTNAQTYAQFKTAEATRINIVFDGANDGFMHAFRTGYYKADGTYAGTTDSSGNFTGTDNDGQELFAYMPEAVLANIHNSTTPALDYSSVNYAHNYYVDATPGTDDLFYGGAWHTWLVSGLGAGGNAIFAIDVTDLANTSKSVAPSKSNIKGEWSTVTTTSSSSSTSTTATTLACYSDTSTSQCGDNLGQTYGTPQIRRLHNGKWAIIFGNGLNSVTGDAGIYVMTIDGTGNPSTVYYLDTGTGTAANPDGIAYVTPVDLDGDHVTDYVYAGDVYGNVWRFDLTSSDPTKWAVSTYGNSGPTPLFTTPTISSTDSNGNALTSTQPITTQLVVLSVAQSGSNAPYVMVEFGTGAVTPQTASTPIQYAPGQQALYGIWDWDMGQSGTPGFDYTGLIGSSSAPTSSSPITTSLLQQQTVTKTTNATGSGPIQGFRTVSNASVCFVGTSCPTVDSTGKTTMSPGTQFGWYMNLPGYAGVSGINGNNQTEQVIYSPIESEGAFIVNTTIPANNSPLTCSVISAQGWTMGLSPATGGAFASSFFADSSGNFINTSGSTISGIALGATGSPSVVTANNLPYMVNQTVSGVGSVNQINPPSGSKGQRLTWLQLH